ncbi:hypothetical protein ACQPW3_13435 [Actinosynnema sp. CA-248983]
MSGTTDLLVAPCTRAAARFAVLRWHYSRTMPVGKIATFGVWEDGVFVGTVIYGRGANSKLGSPYGLTQTECVELVRVALTDHATPVTQIIAATLRQLRASSPGVHLVVSYADSAQGHHGGIYQAGNWIYTGHTGSSDCYYMVNGVKTHGRSVSSWSKPHRAPGETGIEWVRRTVDPHAYRLKDIPVKHRYAYPMNKTTRRRIRRMAKPYPQRTA